MLTALVIIFVLGYLAIALEHPLKINKAAVALFIGTLLWLLWFIGSDTHAANEQLLETLGGLAQIVLFLMGAMTIVAIIEANDGFSIITSNIKTRNIRILMLIISIIAFILSAIIDNLTTAIVMVTLVRKIISDQKTRLYVTGLIIIAANSGGAWSPIGDVTTTMLWIGGQISAVSIIKSLILPSIISLLFPLIVLTFIFKGQIAEQTTAASNEEKPPNFERNLIFGLGIGGLMSVPFIKTLIHVPPYVAMLFVLGIFWIIVEFLGHRYSQSVPKRLLVYHIIKKIDMPNIMFFAGILLAVGVLEASHLLTGFAGILENTFGNNHTVIFVLGIISAIVDNVPLVAATMGMYSLEMFPMDDFIWEFIAFCCGTGGSMLVIGSAAGVVAMGIERKLTFGWYMKRITPLAFLGYCAGAFSYLIIRGTL